MALPVRPRLQNLPLNELRWEDFQRLCARLAQRSGDVEFGQEYGLPGQNQEGIDVYVKHRARGKYAVWQCKRYQEASPALIGGAVEEFVAGDWLKKSDQFILCMSAPIENKPLADEVELQRSHLAKYNVEFLPLGITQISGLLKQHPDLVDDFFGREWVREFCGIEAVANLKRRRLDYHQVARLRQQLRQFYASHFQITDPGLPSLTTSPSRELKPLELHERFIAPDIIVEHDINHVEAPTPTSRPRSEAPSERPPQTHNPIGASRLVRITSQLRRPALDWLSEGDLSVIVGDAGIGKSTLIRHTILDLLRPEPINEKLAIKWGYGLPVWVPFAMWTRMVAEDERSHSLADMLRTWLQQHCASEELQALVQEALKDQRLLLFVDGLDEWSDETAAGTTLTLLQHFVSTHAVPALASSRPLGLKRLGGLSAPWRYGTLAEFSDAQQQQLAHRWFHHRQASLSNLSTDDNQLVNSLAESEARALMKDIRRDGRLTKLAGIPLLLLGMIALRVRGVQLPRKRPEAYEQLTRLLLEEHPRRREKAAHARASHQITTPENLERALARLAYEIHRSPDAVSISKRSARSLLQEWFSSELHKAPDRAFEMADGIVTLGTDGIGVLVEKSPEEIGFVHRAFQEFLSARHLIERNFDELRALVRTFITSPQWYDVLVCVCHLLKRAGEVDQIVAEVERASLAPQAEPARERLLAEIAFGDLHCSTGVAMRLARRTFDIVEAGAWMPVRERLIDHALDGYFSDALGEITRTKIARWFPERHRFLSGVFTAMATWPQEPETVEALWRGLYDEEKWNQRPAAEALARANSSNRAIADRLVRTIMTPTEPTVPPYAVHALCIGWPGDPRLPAILAAGRASGDPVLQLVSLCHRVKRHENDAHDRELFLAISQERRAASYYWREDAIKALISGWPKDEEVKQLAMSSIREKLAWRAGMSRDFAGSLLLQGYAGDEDVAELIAELFRDEEYPQHRLGFSFEWEKLETFSGHPRVAEAVDDWLKRRGKFVLNERLCLVSRSTYAKQLLLHPSHKTGVITWLQADLLLKGWGLEDRETAESLRRFAAHDVGPQSGILFTRLVQDKTECRKRLLQTLNHENSLIAYSAFAGLIELGHSKNDSEVRRLALERFANLEGESFRLNAGALLVRCFPEEPRIREAARGQIHSRGDSIDAVAVAYGDDGAMRAEIIAHISHLPSQLRLRVVDWLAKHSGEEGFASKCLSLCDEDRSALVKTAASIEHAKSVRLRGRTEELALTAAQFAARLGALGDDSSERRQAAFAGLIELDRLNLVPQPSRSDHDLTGLCEMNTRLIQHLAQHWPRIHVSFGSSFWKRIGWTPQELLEEMAYQTNDEGLIQELLSHLRGYLSELRIQARLWQGTDQLRDHCLEILERFRGASDWNNTATAIYAAEILGQQYSAFPEVGARLDALLEDNRDPSPVLVALCLGWPESMALRRVSQRITQSDQGALLPVLAHIGARFAQPKDFLSFLADQLPPLTGSIWEFLPVVQRALQGRFERDETCALLALQRLRTTREPAEKANLPLLLRTCENVAAPLLEWCEQEIRRQNSQEFLPEYAIDMTQGQVRPIAHILTGIVEGS